MQLRRQLGTRHADSVIIDEKVATNRRSESADRPFGRLLVACGAVSVASAYSGGEGIGGTLMSGEAVIMLIVAVIIVWGGLAASVVQLRRRPDQPHDPDA
jgi:hypothetical protein